MNLGGGEIPAGGHNADLIYGKPLVSDIQGRWGQVSAHNGF